MTPSENTPTTVKESIAAVSHRSYARIQANFEVRYVHGAKTLTATAVDIAVGGIAIIGPLSFPVGTDLQLRFRGPNGIGDLIAMNATVRHCNNGRMGLQFLNVAPSDHKRVLDLICRLLQGAKANPPSS